MQDEATATEEKQVEATAAPATKAAAKPAKKATTKKAAAKKAPAKKASDKPVKAPRKSSGEPRRGRGALEGDTLDVCTRFAAGKLKDVTTLTPYTIAKQMVKTETLESTPSVGAISNILDKWGELGFAKINKKPKAFVSFKGDGKRATLDALREKAKAKKAKSK